MSIIRPTLAKAELSNNPLFVNTISMMAANRDTLSNSETTYLNKVTKIANGTLCSCLNKSELFKGDAECSLYDTQDYVFHVWRNFTINSLKKNVIFSCWQDCLEAFLTELKEVNPE